jgi:two-component system OmpR family sensor kinase
MFTSIRSRLWLTYALVISVVLAILAVAVLVYLMRNPYATRQALQRLQILSTVLPRVVELENLNPQQMQEAVERVSRNLEVRVALLGPGGKVMADSAAVTQPPIPDVLSAGERSWFRDVQGQVWLYNANKLTGGRYILLAVPRPRTPFLIILREEFGQPFVWAALLALTLALFLTYWMAKWVAGPLQNLSEGVQAVANGEYNTVPLEGPSEVIEFGQAFNDMVERVHASQQSQADFVANVSHELKTPLTSIQGFAQAILDGTAEDSEEIEQAANVIYSEAGRMNRLVKDLLMLASLEAGTLNLINQPVDLTEILNDVVESLTHLSQRREVTVNVDTESGLLVSGDRDKLFQVFANLLENAVKFTPAAGFVYLRGYKDEHWVEVSMEDTGIGIPPDEIDRIFERFYQVDKARRGGSKHSVGLGLAIAREIVLAHQGEISVGNPPNQGSVFVVKIPVLLG